jgi:micrococcal nuclease
LFFTTILPQWHFKRKREYDVMGIFLKSLEPGNIVGPRKLFGGGILLLAVVGMLFTSGCTGKQEVTCNPPYIQVGVSCCLDQNNNSICDKDEASLIETQQNVTKNTSNTAVLPANQSSPTVPPQTQQTISENITETTQNVTSIVSTVVDGDTVKLQTGETIRLLGINAPERGQPYYDEATDRLKELIGDKEIVLEKDIDDKDQYGRLLRYIFLSGENIDVKLVREGLATVWVIPPNTKYEDELQKAENEAKELKLNIWKPPEQGQSGDICDNRCIGISYFRWDAEGNDCYNLNDEYVTFKNSCPYSCDLTGWSVKDESSRNPYVFPTFVLETGKSTTLYTGCGTNNTENLYWCSSSGYSCKAIWNNDGDTLYLRNSNNELVLSYSYPR